MWINRNRVLLGAIFLLFVGLVSVRLPHTFAQGIIIDPPPNPPGTPVRTPIPAPIVDPITIALHQVDAVIDGPVASVHLTQIFRNDSNRTVEGTYIFPLPEDAAVSDFQMTVDGQTLEGKLLSKAEARQIYEEIVRRQRDPALLEYIGRGLFQASVFPIPAGASRTLELTYTQILKRSDSLYTFKYPLRTQQYSHSPVEALAINIELRNQPGLRTIYSPSHQVSVERSGDTSAQIGYEASHVQAESDFELFFATADSAIGLNVLSYKPAGEDGFFALIAAPGVEVDAQAVVARDIVLVLDVSGSMQGEKIEQARKAADVVVDLLNPDDRLNLISFSTGVRLWKPTLQTMDAATIKDAHSWIDRLTATGSTDINRALLEALGQLQRPGVGDRPGYLLFMTDGLPTQGETDVQRIIGNALNNKPIDSAVRIFTFGVGFDVNTDLLDTLSSELGGRSTYVQPDEQIDEKIGQFYSGISTPVLSGVALDFGAENSDEIVIDELYPYPLPDLFAGEQLVVVGRYQEGATLPITLRGVVNGEKVSYHYPNQQLVTSGGEAFVARLWATRKIGALIAQVRRTGPAQEVMDEITNLSLQYGIVTPYTSYLVQEPNLATGQTQPQPDLAPEEMRQSAADAVETAVMAQASAPASGAEAVAASEKRMALQTAVIVEARPEVRFVGGKTFVQQGVVTTLDGQSLALWVDTSFAANMQIETVLFGSERYFALAQQPTMARWLAISPELIVVTAPDQALRITTVQP